MRENRKIKCNGLLSVPVRAVRFLEPDSLLISNGKFMQQFTIERRKNAASTTAIRFTTLTRTLQVFHDQQIHHIFLLSDCYPDRTVSANDNLILFTSETNLKLFRSDFPTNLPIASWETSDWILAVRIFVLPTDNELNSSVTCCSSKRAEDLVIVTVTAHNHVQLWSLPTLATSTTSTMPSNVRSGVCPDQHVSFSAAIGLAANQTKTNDRYDIFWYRLQIVSGTIFAEIIVWMACSGNVLHRLHGHEGTIFSVDLSTRLSEKDSKHLSLQPQQQLVSVCDKKILSLWTNFEESARVHDAHNDRIFVVKHVENSMPAGNRVLTLGEDCKLKLWTHGNDSFTERCLRLEFTLENQLGSKFRCFDNNKSACPYNDQIVAGSSNGSVLIMTSPNALFPLSSGFSRRKICVFKSKVKKLYITKRNSVITVHDDRSLRYANRVFGFLGTKNAVIVCALSPERTFFATVNCENGILSLYHEIPESEIHNIELLAEKPLLEYGYFNYFFALFWISNNQFVIFGECNGANCFRILTAQNAGLIDVGKTIFLFTSGDKKRFSNLNLVTCATIIDLPKILLVGDRKSTLTVYCNKSDCKEQVVLKSPLQVIHRTHSFLGITSIVYSRESQVVTTIGRDSTLKKYRIVEGRERHEDPLLLYLRQVECEKLPFSWPTAIFCNRNESYVCGFEGSEFIIYNRHRRMVIIREPCKGAHRAFDFAINKSYGSLQLSYASRSQIVNCELLDYEQQFLFVRDGYHSDRIRAMLAVPLTTDYDGLNELEQVANKKTDYGNCDVQSSLFLLISGGEDTLLNFILVSKETETKNYETCNATGGDHRLLFSIKTHLSSVRCLDRCGSYLISAGGRSQFILWRIYTKSTCRSQIEHVEPQMLHNCQVPNTNDLEMRIMSTVLVTDCNQHKAILATSDGSVFVYRFDVRRICLEQSARTKSCLTVIRKYYTSSSNVSIILGNVTGHIMYGQVDNLAKLKSHLVHKAPITSCCCYNIPFKQLDQTILVVTGCDIGSIAVSRITMTASECDSFEVLIRVPITVSSQINGLLCTSAAENDCENEFNVRVTSCTQNQRLFEHEFKIFKDKKGNMTCEIAIMQMRESDFSSAYVSNVCHVSGLCAITTRSFCVFGSGFEICDF